MLFPKLMLFGLESQQSHFDAVCPETGKKVCPLRIGMQIEVADFAVLLVEEFGVIFKGCKGTVITTEHAIGINGSQLSDDRVIRLQTIETCLQIFGAIVGRRTVPDGIVHHDVSISIAGEESVNDGPHVEVVLLGAYRRTVAGSLCTIVRAEHNGKHMFGTRSKESVGGFNEWRKATRFSIRQPVVGSRSAEATIDVTDAEACFTEYAGCLGSGTFRLGMRQACSLCNAIADEHYLHRLCVLRPRAKSATSKEER